MADIDLKVKSTYAGKSQTLTISDANPQASDAVLLELGQRVNALTDNTYSSTDKVTTINLDTETSAGKTKPTLTLSPDTVSAATLNSGNTVNLSYSYNGDATTTQFTTPKSVNYYIRDNNNTVSIHNVDPSLVITTGTLEVGFPETDTYQAISATITIV